MRKLSRKEFKELLIEWNNNFVNERVTPSLNKYITAPKQNFTIIQVEEVEPKFKEELTKSNINFSFTGNIIVQCDKQGSNIKDFILSKFTLDKENKDLLEENYKNRDPILVASATFSGNFSENQLHTKEECLYWLIHDLFHANFDHGRFGQSSFLDSFTQEDTEFFKRHYKNLFPDLNYDFKDFSLEDLMDHDEEFVSYEYDYKQTTNHKHVIPELVQYLKSINFTVGIESFDLIPSIFSFCLIKMPNPDDVSNLYSLLDRTNLSNAAKTYLLAFNIVSKRTFKDIIFPDFENKVSFLDLN